MHLKTIAAFATDRCRMFFAPWRLPFKASEGIQGIRRLGVQRQIEEAFDSGLVTLGFPDGL